MDVKRAIAELTSQVSEINYDSDEEGLLKDSQTFDDAQAEDSYEIGTSKLRKITDSPIFSEQVYGGKKTTRKKTYSLSETSNNGISESASFDESSDHATESSDEDNNKKESEDDSSYTEYNKVNSSRKKKASQNEALDFNIYSAGSKNISNDIKKGTAIRNQLRVWEYLLECRIKLQNGLVACNNLPPSNNLLKAKIDLNSEDQLKLSKCKKNLLILLGKMVDLQKSLMKQCCESREQKDDHLGEEMDEEINSDSSEVEDGLEEKEDEPERKKRKLNDYSTLIRNNHNKFILFRNASIQKWNEKTKISTGKIANSNFSAFDQSTLKQIEQIMSEKSRLINRTRIKRNDGRKVDSKNQENFTHDSKESILNAEIFDDTDFYHKLLRDYIERKSVDATNPSHTEKQMIELQKLRSKMKKNVDTKSTKGRKLRFVILPKLVNFMAPHPYNSWSQQAETELFSSLFGNIKVAC